MKKISLAAFAAAIISLLGEIILWVAFTNQFPEILFKDTQRAAAIVLGPKVLAEPSIFDPTIFGVAGVVHLGLSLAYSFLFAYLIRFFKRINPLLLGVVFGLLLFGVNMYAMTTVFPWFAADRDWITLSVHVLFGLTLAAMHKLK